MHNPPSSPRGYFLINHRESVADDSDMKIATMENLLTKTSQMLRDLRTTYDKYENNGNRLTFTTIKDSFASGSLET
jgi:DNA polymerase IIIc chi subunit